MDLSVAKKPLCHICHETAYRDHLNYGAISCYSCRAFFRRIHKITLDKPKFICKFGGTCEINLKTRRKCKKCRYDFCVRAGMQAKSVLKEGERKSRFRNSFYKDRKAPTEDQEDDDEDEEKDPESSSNSSDFPIKPPRSSPQDFFHMVGPPDYLPSHGAPMRRELPPPPPGVAPAPPDPMPALYPLGPSPVLPFITGAEVIQNHLLLLNSQSGIFTHCPCLTQCEMAESPMNRVQLYQVKQLDDLRRSWQLAYKDFRRDPEFIRNLIATMEGKEELSKSLFRQHLSKLVGLFHKFAKGLGCFQVSAKTLLSLYLWKLKV